MIKKDEAENRALNESQKEQIRKWTLQNPKNLEQVKQNVK